MDQAPNFVKFEKESQSALKEPDASILRVISKVKERFEKLRKIKKTMGLEVKGGYPAAALRAVTVILAPVDYKQVIL